jgi:hypothetical protein
VTTRRQSGSGTHGGVRRSRFLGATIALVALCLQLAAAGLYLPLPLAAAPAADAELARLFDAHALCIAGVDRPSPQMPADKSPAAPHHHLGICCPGHGAASPCVPTPATVAAIAFVHTTVSFPTVAAIIVAARLPGTASARAPPIDA